MEPPANNGNFSKQAKKRSNFWNRKYNSRGRTNQNPPNETPVVFKIPSSSTPVQTDSQPLINVMLDKVPDKYPEWSFYIPGEAFMTGSSTVKKIEAMENHIKENPLIYDIQAIKDLLLFPLQIQNLQQDEKFLKNYTNFHQEMCEKPEYFLGCIGLAMHQTITNSSASQSTTIYESFSRIHPRILGFSPLMKLSSLKTNKIGKLVTAKGTVMRVSAAQLICTWMTWKCRACEAEQVVRQTNNITIQPESCKDKCRVRSNFIPLPESEFNVTEFVQILKLQELSLGREFGRIPLHIDIEVNQDLVDSVSPGDEVTVTGILKVRAQEENSKIVVTHMFKMYIEAVSLTSSKNSFTKKETEYSEKDLELIKTITNQPCPFRLLVHSLCPSIYGHEMVKAGLVLGLFGGGTDTERRSEVHVLVVGDPGVGKSQMLLACSNVSPRGVLVCGDTSSQAGLTVAIRQEKGTSGSIEAGALVLANQGTCCIDEFDKMAANHKVLLDVMEAQTISIAKAGVLCSFPAKTTILAAANPSGGHYNKGKTVAENLKMGHALLSRFDLVFILLDNADEKLDQMITTHNQKVRAGNQVGNQGLTPSYSSYISNPDLLNETTSGADDRTIPLDQRLRLLPDEKMDYLPHLLMQKYISYTKKNMTPVLTDRAEIEIQQFYKELRSAQCSSDAIPVTTRQLEALVRMTQSRARIDFSLEATHHHVRDVIAIVKYSMRDVLTTNVGSVQINRSMNGSGVSLATQIKSFIRLLRDKSITAGPSHIYTLDQLKDIAQPQGFAGNINEIIDSLNCKGFLLKRGRNQYQFVDF